MKAIIFGATGTIGKQLVLQSLAQGHLVTAFVRDPAKLSGILHPNLQFAKGDVLDYASVEKAIKDQDVVLCALGSGRKGTVRSQGTANIVKAMEAAGHKRLICQTTLGCGDSWQTLNFFWKRIMFGWFIKEAFQDHELQEKIIKNSSLDWTIIRPSAFIDGPVTGNYKHGFSTADKNMKLKISRADVAFFMLSQLTDFTYLKQTPALSY